MIHLTLNQISAYLDAELPVASVELVRLHLSACLECTQQFAQIEEQEEMLGRLLSNDPGEPFFEGFADRVLGPKVSAKPESRVERSAGVVAPEERPRPERPVAEPPAPPKSRESRPSAAPVPRADRTRPPKRRRRSRVLLPLAVLAFLASSIAVMVVARNEPAMKRLHSRPPERAESPTAPTPPQTESAVGAGLESALGSLLESAGDGAAGADALERAAASSAEADRHRTAAGYESAAVAWEEALLRLHDPNEVAAARHEIAAARFGAWEVEPTPERREAATAAVRSDLLSAPPGTQRDLAWSWLAKLKR